MTAKPGADGPRRPRSSAGGRGGRQRGRRRRGADAPAAGRVRWLMRPGRTTNEGIFTRLGGRARRWGSLLGAPGRFARCTWQFWSSLPSMPIRVSFGPCLVKMSRRALVVVVPAPATSPAPQRRASSPGGWRAGGADRDATNPRGRVRCCRAFCLLAGHHDQSILLTRPRARRRRPALRAPGLAQPSSGEAEAMVAAAAPWLRQDGAGVADFRDGHGRGEPAATPRPPLAGQGRGQPGGGAGGSKRVNRRAEGGGGVRRGCKAGAFSVFRRLVDLAPQGGARIATGSPRHEDDPDTPRSACRTSAAARSPDWMAPSM